MLSWALNSYLPWEIIITSVQATSDLRLPEPDPWDWTFHDPAAEEVMWLATLYLGPYKVREVIWKAQSNQLTGYVKPVWLSWPYSLKCSCANRSPNLKGARRWWLWVNCAKIEILKTIKLLFSFYGLLEWQNLWDLKFSFCYLFTPGLVFWLRRWSIYSSKSKIAQSAGAVE